MFQHHPERLVVLVADNSSERYFLIKETIRESYLNPIVRYVNSGLELVDYLLEAGSYTESISDFPNIIIASNSLNDISGAEALKMIGDNKKFASIRRYLLIEPGSAEELRSLYSVKADGIFSLQANDSLRFQAIIKQVLWRYSAVERAQRQTLNYERTKY